jgi:hypothetical protein
MKEGGIAARYMEGMVKKSGGHAAFLVYIYYFFRR